jgi:hypothetical protein
MRRKTVERWFMRLPFIIEGPVYLTLSGLLVDFVDRDPGVVPPVDNMLPLRGRVWLSIPWILERITDPEGVR